MPQVLKMTKPERVLQNHGRMVIWRVRPFIETTHAKEYDTCTKERYMAEISLAVCASWLIRHIVSEKGVVKVDQST